MANPLLAKQSEWCGFVETLSSPVYIECTKHNDWYNRYLFENHWIASTSHANNFHNNRNRLCRMFDSRCITLKTHSSSFHGRYFYSMRFTIVKCVLLFSCLHISTSPINISCQTVTKYTCVCVRVCVVQHQRFLFGCECFVSEYGT